MLSSNRRTIKFKVDGDDEEYDLPSNHVFRSQRVIQGTAPKTPPPFEIFDRRSPKSYRALQIMLHRPERLRLQFEIFVGAESLTSR